MIYPQGFITPLVNYENVLSCSV